MKSTLFSGLRREVVKRLERCERNTTGLPLRSIIVGRYIREIIIIRKLYSSILCYFLFVKEQIDANFVVNTWSDS